MAYLRHLATNAIDASAATLEFTVWDTGIGLSPEQLARLFHSFEQADASTTRRYGGTGLGLVISKRLVELMGGSIQVTSEVGVGSLFSFTLHQRLGQGSARLRVPTPDLRGKRILVVDDNASAREVMSYLLKSMTFRVDAAASGVQALAMLQETKHDGQPFDAVLLDWHMPEMDGIASAHQIRQLALDLAPRMIMVTAYGRDDLVDLAQAAGIVDVVQKPVSGSILFDALMRAFKAGSPGRVRIPAAISGQELFPHSRVLRSCLPPRDTCATQAWRACPP